MEWTSWVLLVLMWANILASSLLRRADKGLIQAQRNLIASLRRETEMLGENVEWLWPYYRRVHPDAPAQPPHVLAATTVAADQLKRQTNDNNSEGGQ